MAASRLDDEDSGLKLDPNFELLAILLALALQEEDADRFLEVYDHIVPKSMSAFEVDNIKDRARELSDLPAESLLELKAAQESEGGLFQASPAGSLGRFISRRIADSHHGHQTGEGDSHPGKFLSKSGALLSQRLSTHPPTAPCGELDAQPKEETLSHLDNVGEYLRVDSGCQTGLSFTGQRDFLPEQETLRCPTDDDLVTGGDDTSNLTPNQWSTMEAATAHSKVRKAQKSSVKQVPRSNNSSSFGQDHEVLTNGSVDNVKCRTSNSTDKGRHCIKSKPPQTGATPGPVKSKKVTSKPNCHLTHIENSYFDDICELEDHAKEEKEALIPKSPPVPNSPPFKSFEEVGHSVGELLTNSQPKNSTCPPPLFLSKTTATLAHPNAVDCSMAAKSETKYGTIPYTNLNNSASGNDDVHQREETGLTKSGALTNHHSPDNDITEDSAHAKTNSFSTSEVPSHVNKSALNVCSSGGEASDHLDKEEFDGGGGSVQASNIAGQWNDAKKKKKKNKRKKSSGTGVDTVNANNVKLPVGASPMLLSNSELRYKHQLRDSQNAGRLTGASTKPNNETANETARHPPPMVSSDSVTSSGESSTDGGMCANDIGGQHHGAPVKKDRADSSNSDTVPTSNTSRTSTGAVVSNNLKDLPRTQENPLTKQEPVDTTSSAADLHVNANVQPANQIKTHHPNPGHTVKSDPSDSDSDRNEVKIHRIQESISQLPTAFGKPHSLSEPTASADSSADNDDNFIKVESKRTLRSAKKRGCGVSDDQKITPYPGRYNMYMDRDRDNFRNRNVLFTGLRKSSSEPTGMSELGDKEAEESGSNKAKPPNLTDSLNKMDANLMSSVPSEPTTVPRSEFSYASKVKSNMKTSSLPPKLSPQALLDYVDDEQSDNPATGDNSPEAVSGIKSTAFETKAMPSGKSVLDKNNPNVAEKNEFINMHTAKEQFVKNNMRPERHCNVSPTMKSPDASTKLGQNRSFQRSSSVDTNEVIKKVSFDDNSIRRTIPPQGPEASVQYLDLTYAGRLKTSKPPAVTQKNVSSDVQQVPVAGLKDLKSKPTGLKQQDTEVLLTSKASIVLSTNPASATNEATRGNTVASRPIRSNPIALTESKPVDQSINSGSRPAAASLPPALPRNSTSSPTPSVGSSSSRPHPTFDLEPQENFDITFGSVIVGKVGYEILGEDVSAARRGSPVEELFSKVRMSVQVPTPQGLSCAELEQSILNQDAGRSTNAKVDDVKKEVSSPSLAASGVSFGKFDGAWGIREALEGKDDSIRDFNHQEVAEMLLAEWRKTQEEIRQNKVLII